MAGFNKQKEIVDLLFDISSKDKSVTISGHCGGMVFTWEDGNKHVHICSFLDYNSQLTHMVDTLKRIKE